MPNISEAILSERGGFRVILIALFLFLIYIINFFSIVWSNENFLQPFDGYILISSLVSGALGLVIVTAARLDLLSNSMRRERSERRVDDLTQQISSLHEQVRSLSANVTTTEGLRALAESVFKERIEAQISAISINHIAKLTKDELVSSYKPNVFRERAIKEIRETIDDYVDGVRSELRSQRRAANQNLVWGIVFSLAGLATMGFFLFEPLLRQEGSLYSHVAENSEWKIFLQSFIPKFTFVILFESIAFFFFRSYAEDRGMLKYLRNEVTNIESKTLSLISTLYFSSEEHQNAIFRQMMSTERNFTIKRGDKIIVEALADANPILFEELARRIVPKFDTKWAQNSTT